MVLALGLGVFVLLLGGDEGVIPESFFFAALRVTTVISSGVQRDEVKGMDLWGSACADSDSI
jgi:hypothetical protein